MSSKSIFQSFQSKQGLPVSVSRPPPVSAVHIINDADSTINSSSSNKGEQEEGGGIGIGINVGIRRRLSSLSLKIQLQNPPSSSSIGYLMGSFRRSKSISSMGEYAGSSIRKWWDWGWAWILSRKPTFAQDLEMNDQESAVLGYHNKGSWGHVFFKVKGELGKLVGGSSDNMGLPQTLRSSSYHSSNYSKINLDSTGTH